MATHQQPELERSGTSAVDPASAKSHLSTARPGGAGRLGKVPADNTPGHHPEHDQDKPIEKFRARAEEQAREARAEAPAGDAAADDHPADGAPTSPSDGDGDSGPLAAGRSTGAGPAPSVVPTRRGGVAGLTLGSVVPLVSLMDAARRPAAEWDAIGESRTSWLARIALLGVLGAHRYATDVRPRLEAAGRAESLAGA